MQRLNEEEGVECIVNDACMFGMKAVGKDGQEGPARKPTTWMTNAPYLAKHLAGRCNGAHAHAPLLRGRAARAAVCPPELVEAIVW